MSEQTQDALARFVCDKPSGSYPAFALRTRINSQEMGTVIELRPGTHLCRSHLIRLYNSVSILARHNRESISSQEIDVFED
jgi:hypothetical protein